MLVLESPLDAYRSDLARTKQRGDFGGADTVWLLAAHCLARLGRASAEDSLVIARQCAEALSDFLAPDGASDDTRNSEERDLRLVIDGLERLRDRSGADTLARGVRGMASRMADAGALSMAYTTLAHTREVVFCACDRERGLLTADQAKISRLLGDLDSAEELYQLTASIGERSVDFALISRACVGRGVVNRVRGNYPRARVFFERALELAETARSPELMLLAHQGLTICFAVAKDFDRALQHGWATFELSAGETAREIEALGNLSQLCLDSGYPRAALQGFAAVLQRSDVLRVCLSVLGGAAVAAARCGETHVLHRVEEELAQKMLRSALPYENAQALYHLALAFTVIGDAARSADYVQRTRRLAKARGFFELLHSIETEEFTRAATQSVAARELSKPSRVVVDSVAGLEVGETARVLALSR